MNYLRLCLICLFSAQMVTAQRPVDILHYSFSINLNDNDDMMIGHAEIKFVALDNIQEITLDLAGLNTDKKGMIVEGAGFLSSNTSLTRYKHENGKLTIPSSSPLRKGDTATVVINYKGVPLDGLIISRNKYRHRTFFADNWPNRGHNWLPCVDEPGDKASVEFLVTAPQHYQVVSNGILIEETNLNENEKLTHWKEDVPVSTKVMVIGVADFAVNLSGTVDGCIPVYSWVYPEDRVKGFYDYALAAQILPFFISNVGPYGYKKLANVQSKTTFGGLENANTIFYAENSITGTRNSETLLAHEIAHQWFGNMATEKTFAHLWLSEGFATYMTIWYMEKKYGADTAISMLKEDRRQVIVFAKNSDRTVVDESKDYMELLNANSYQKGGWILHMLRRQLGDSVFAKSIKSYYAQYAGKTADTRDLQRVFETVSRKKLETFFSQWLYMPGLPRLDIQWTYSDKDKKLLLTVKQLQPSAFQFPLEIGIKSGDAKMKIETVQIIKSEQTFTIPIKEKITSIVADPKVSLLFEASVKEKK